MPRYNPAQIEPKWQRYWEQHKTFASPRVPSGKKLYALDMFPYPSGDGLHVGHPEGYTATDIVSRYARMRGRAVMHPMGFDAFGLPAEEHAIKTGTPPRVSTEKNIANFTRQLKMLGFSYDWDRCLTTADVGYYRWTQWIFLELYDTWYDPQQAKGRPIAELPIPDDVKSEGEAAVVCYRDEHRLAYESFAPVNWCPALGTVLANEEVIDGKSEVGGHPVVRMPLRQWMLRITAYADRLEKDLEGLDWSDGIKALQRNWIGRSTGAEVDFFIGRAEDRDDGVPIAKAFEKWKSSRASGGKSTDGSRFPRKPGDEALRVYTTRPDTLFGATYMVIAPEHPMVEHLTHPGHAAEVHGYQEQAAAKSDLDRTELAKEKTGVFTGSYAINPVNGQPIPIWIADYVLMGYGTGAIMAVPAHDTRDFEFARQYEIAIVPVVDPQRDTDEVKRDDVLAARACATCDGVAVNSGAYNGLSTAEFKEKIAADLAEQGLGRAAVNYKLRDWLFSRQRFWGEPFPLLHELDANNEPTGVVVPLAASDLPLELPDLADFKPHGRPEPPLEKAPKDWLYVERDGRRYKRETNTMPQWAGSCWYYLRYLDPANDQALVDPEVERAWMPVDLYIGGLEHAVLHLLYARFWHKVLYDRGHVSTPEPFQKLVNQGMILGEGGHKMSKSRGNVLNPDSIVKDYGADSLRLYEMFMGPLEATKPWSMEGVNGVRGFLDRAWRMIVDDRAETVSLVAEISDAAPTTEQNRVLHKTLQAVTDDLERMSFNTAIARLMEFVNFFLKQKTRPRFAMEPFVLMLSPLAPHLAEELWAALGHEQTLAYERWPAYDAALAKDDTVEIPVQILGKLRGKVTVAADATQQQIEAAARGDEKVALLLDGKNIVKVIVVPGRLVNFVVK